MLINLEQSYFGLRSKPSALTKLNYDPSTCMVVGQWKLLLTNVWKVSTMEGLINIEILFQNMKKSMSEQIKSIQRAFSLEGKKAIKDQITNLISMLKNVKQIIQKADDYNIKLNCSQITQQLQTIYGLYPLNFEVYSLTVQIQRSLSQVKSTGYNKDKTNEHDEPKNQKKKALKSVCISQLPNIILTLKEELYIPSQTILSNYIQKNLGQHPSLLNYGLNLSFQENVHQIANSQPKPTSSSKQFQERNKLLLELLIYNQCSTVKGLCDFLTFCKNILLDKKSGTLQTDHQTWKAIYLVCLKIYSTNQQVRRQKWLEIDQILVQAAQDAEFNNFIKEQTLSKKLSFSLASLNFYLKNVGQSAQMDLDQAVMIKCKQILCEQDFQWEYTEDIVEALENSHSSREIKGQLYILAFKKIQAIVYAAPNQNLKTQLNSKGNVSQIENGISYFIENICKHSPQMILQFFNENIILKIHAQLKQQHTAHSQLSQDLNSALVSQAITTHRQLLFHIFSEFLVRIHEYNEHFDQGDEQDQLSNKKILNFTRYLVENPLLYKETLPEIIQAFRSCGFICPVPVFQILFEKKFLPENLEFVNQFLWKNLAELYLIQSLEENMQMNVFHENEKSRIFISQQITQNLKKVMAIQLKEKTQLRKCYSAESNSQKPKQTKNTRSNEQFYRTAFFNVKSFKECLIFNNLMLIAVNFSDEMKVTQLAPFMFQFYTPSGKNAKWKLLSQPLQSVSFLQQSLTIFPMMCQEQPIQVLKTVYKFLKDDPMFQWDKVLQEKPEKATKTGGQCKSQTTSISKLSSDFWNKYLSSNMSVRIQALSEEPSLTFNLYEQLHHLRKLELALALLNCVFDKLNQHSQKSIKQIKIMYEWGTTRVKSFFSHLYSSLIQSVSLDLNKLNNLNKDCKESTDNDTTAAQRQQRQRQQSIVVSYRLCEDNSISVLQKHLNEYFLYETVKDFICEIGGVISHATYEKDMGVLMFPIKVEEKICKNALNPNISHDLSNSQSSMIKILKMFALLQNSALVGVFGTIEQGQPISHQNKLYKTVSRQHIKSRGYYHHAKQVFKEFSSINFQQLGQYCRQNQAIAAQDKLISKNVISSRLLSHLKLILSKIYLPLLTQELLKGNGKSKTEAKQQDVSQSDSNDDICEYEEYQSKNEQQRKHIKSTLKNIEILQVIQLAIECTHRIDSDYQDHIADIMEILEKNLQIEQLQNEQQNTGKLEKSKNEKCKKTSAQAQDKKKADIVLRVLDIFFQSVLKNIKIRSYHIYKLIKSYLRLTKSQQKKTQFNQVIEHYVTRFFRVFLGNDYQPNRQIRSLSGFLEKEQEKNVPQQKKQQKNTPQQKTQPQLLSQKSQSVSVVLSQNKSFLNKSPKNQQKSSQSPSPSPPHAQGSSPSKKISLGYLKQRKQNGECFSPLSASSNRNPSIDSPGNYGGCPTLNTLTIRSRKVTSYSGFGTGNGNKKDQQEQQKQLRKRTGQKHWSESLLLAVQDLKRHQYQSVSEKKEGQNTHVSKQNIQIPNQNSLASSQISLCSIQKNPEFVNISCTLSMFINLFCRLNYDCSLSVGVGKVLSAPVDRLNYMNYLVKLTNMIVALGQKKCENKVDSKIPNNYNCNNNNSTSPFISERNIQILNVDVYANLNISFLGGGIPSTSITFYEQSRHQQQPESQIVPVHISDQVFLQKLVELTKATLKLKTPYIQTAKQMPIKLLNEQIGRKVKGSQKSKGKKSSASSADSTGSNSSSTATVTCCYQLLSQFQNQIQPQAFSLAVKSHLFKICPGILQSNLNLCNLEAITGQGSSSLTSTRVMQANQGILLKEMSRNGLIKSISTNNRQNKKITQKRERNKAFKKFMKKYENTEWKKERLNIKVEPLAYKELDSMLRQLLESYKKLDAKDNSVQIQVQQKTTQSFQTEELIYFQFRKLMTVLIEVPQLISYALNKDFCVQTEANIKTNKKYPNTLMGLVLDSLRYTMILFCEFYASLMKTNYGFTSKRCLEQALIKAGLLQRGIIVVQEEGKNAKTNTKTNNKTMTTPLQSTIKAGSKIFQKEWEKLINYENKSSLYSQSQNEIPLNMCFEMVIKLKLTSLVTGQNVLDEEGSSLPFNNNPNVLRALNFTIKESSSFRLRFYKFIQAHRSVGEQLMKCFDMCISERLISHSNSKSISSSTKGLEQVLISGSGSKSKSASASGSYWQMLQTCFLQNQIIAKNEFIDYAKVYQDMCFKDRDLNNDSMDSAANYIQASQYSLKIMKGGSQFLMQQACDEIELLGVGIQKQSILKKKDSKDQQNNISVSPSVNSRKKRNRQPSIIACQGARLISMANNSINVNKTALSSNTTGNQNHSHNSSPSSDNQSQRNCQKISLNVPNATDQQPQSIQSSDHQQPEGSLSQIQLTLSQKALVMDSKQIKRKSANINSISVNLKCDKENGQQISKNIENNDLDDNDRDSEKTDDEEERNGEEQGEAKAKGRKQEKSQQQSQEGSYSRVSKTYNKKGVCPDDNVGVVIESVPSQRVMAIIEFSHFCVLDQREARQSEHNNDSTNSDTLASTSPSTSTSSSLYRFPIIQKQQPNALLTLREVQDVKKWVDLKSNLNSPIGRAFGELNKRIIEERFERENSVYQNLLWEDTPHLNDVMGGDIIPSGRTSSTLYPTTLLADRNNSLQASGGRNRNGSMQQRLLLQQVQPQQQVQGQQQSNFNGASTSVAVVSASPNNADGTLPSNIPINTSYSPFQQMQQAINGLHNRQHSEPQPNSEAIYNSNGMLQSLPSYEEQDGFIEEQEEDDIEQNSNTNNINNVECDDKNVMMVMDQIMDDGIYEDDDNDDGNDDRGQGNDGGDCIMQSYDSIVLSSQAATKTQNNLEQVVQPQPLDQSRNYEMDGIVSSSSCSSCSNGSNGSINDKDDNNHDNCNQNSNNNEIKQVVSFHAISESQSIPNTDDNKQQKQGHLQLYSPSIDMLATGGGISDKSMKQGDGSQSDQSDDSDDENDAYDGSMIIESDKSNSSPTPNHNLNSSAVDPSSQESLSNRQPMRYRRNEQSMRSPHSIVEQQNDDQNDDDNDDQIDNSISSPNMNNSSNNSYSDTEHHSSRLAPTKESMLELIEEYTLNPELLKTLKRRIKLLSDQELEKLILWTSGKVRKLCRRQFQKRSNDTSNGKQQSTSINCMLQSFSISNNEEDSYDYDIQGGYGYNSHSIFTSLSKYLNNDSTLMPLIDENRLYMNSYNRVEKDEDRKMSYLTALHEMIPLMGEEQWLNFVKMFCQIRQKETAFQRGDQKEKLPSTSAQIDTLLTSKDCFQDLFTKLTLRKQNIENFYSMFLSMIKKFNVQAQYNIQNIAISQQQHNLELLNSILNQLIPKLISSRIGLALLLKGQCNRKTGQLTKIAIQSGHSHHMNSSSNYLGMPTSAKNISVLQVILQFYVQSMTLRKAISMGMNATINQQGKGFVQSLLNYLDEVKFRAEYNVPGSSSFPYYGIQDTVKLAGQAVSYNGNDDSNEGSSALMKKLIIQMKKMSKLFNTKNATEKKKKSDKLSQASKDIINLMNYLDFETFSDFLLLMLEENKDICQKVLQKELGILEKFQQIAQNKNLSEEKLAQNYWRMRRLKNCDDRQSDIEWFADTLTQFATEVFPQFKQSCFNFGFGKQAKKKKDKISSLRKALSKPAQKQRRNSINQKKLRQQIDALQKEYVLWKKTQINNILKQDILPILESIASIFSETLSKWQHVFKLLQNIFPLSLNQPAEERNLIYKQAGEFYKIFLAIDCLIEEENIQHLLHSMSSLKTKPSLESTKEMVTGKRRSSFINARVSIQNLKSGICLAIDQNGNNSSGNLYSNIMNPQMMKKQVLKKTIKGISLKFHFFSEMINDHHILLRSHAKYSQHTDSKLKLLHRKNTHSQDLTLKINRQTPWLDTFKHIRTKQDEEKFINSSVKIQIGEEIGLDYGGVTRQWITLLVKQLVNPDLGLFQLSVNGLSFQPSKTSWIIPGHLQHFYKFGILVGKALKQNWLIQVNFTRSFLKHLLGYTLYVQDLEDIDPQTAKSLMWILNNQIDEDLGMYFTCEVEKPVGFRNENQKVTEIQLIQNGSEIAVNDQNKKEYVKKLAQYKMTEQIREQSKAFRSGIQRVVPYQTLNVFTYKELGIYLAGMPTVDIQQMQLYARYQGGFNHDSQTIKWFWSCLRQYTPQKIANFLFFLTGSYKVPYGGFKEHPITINKLPGSQIDYLPVAHTCFSVIDLSEFTTESKLAMLMEKGIEEGKGFSVS